MLNMILAIDRGNAIGWSDGRLPWHLPGDMKRFKQLTSGSTVVMGFNTYKSLNRKEGLPNRRNMVLTKRSLFAVKDEIGDTIELISSFDWIQEHQKCLGCQSPDLWIIGGAQIYEEALDRNIVDRIYLTLVDANSGADVVLKKYDLAAWKLFIIREASAGRIWNIVQHEECGTDTSPAYSFLTLEKQ